METYNLPQSTILKIYSERDEIIVDPEYQRYGDIWSLENRQLLIDSILNDYDIPKIYFHRLDDTIRFDSGKSFAIIDGRQRIETIWGFIEGNFTLADDFKYLRDSSINAAGMTYADLAKNYPRLKIKFDSISLPIIAVANADLDLIEEMFSRLNEAVPLNAAEKRNAFGGTMARIIRGVAKHDLFTEKILFSNKRYKHLEAAAKILFLVHSLNHAERVIDTKKVYLDQFVKANKEANTADFAELRSDVNSVLDEMFRIFIARDPLLRAQGTFPIYFLLVRDLYRANRLPEFSRDKIIRFNERLKSNRMRARKNIADANFELLEFDRMSQQGTNDASSITTRLQTLKANLNLL